jgi:hypothetical protein
MKLFKDLALLSSVQIVAARRFSERVEYVISESGTNKNVRMSFVENPLPKSVLERPNRK